MPEAYAFGEQEWERHMQELKDKLEDLRGRIAAILVHL